jgi:hypothetical protein
MSQNPGSHDIEYWSDNEFQQFQAMELSVDAEADPWLQMLFDIAMFSPDETYDVHVAARSALEIRLRDEYGIDFEDAFDWNAYRLMGESDA